MRQRGGCRGRVQHHQRRLCEPFGKEHPRQGGFLARSRVRRPFRETTPDLTIRQTHRCGCDAGAHTARCCCVWTMGLPMAPVTVVRSPAPGARCLRFDAAVLFGVLDCRWPENTRRQQPRCTNKQPCLCEQQGLFRRSRAVLAGRLPGDRLCVWAVSACRGVVCFL